jgi:hypothetical protein
MPGTVATPDLWLAELTARAGLEPLLAVRYGADARGVLAEFGVVLGADEQPPSLLRGVADDDLCIDILDQSFAVAGQCTNGGSCNADMRRAQPQRLEGIPVPA